jgi:hypothetical protein
MRRVRVTAISYSDDGGSPCDDIAPSTKGGRKNGKDLAMNKLVKIVAVMGFAALSAFAAHAMTDANAGSATHWSVNAGAAR